MRITNRLLLCACVVLSLGGTSSAKEWRGVIPLHSTRTDVERLLGKPNAKYDRYEFESERASIIYSSEPCAAGSQWNVPRDTVIQISITPKKTLQLSDLRLDLNKYERAKDPSVTAHTFYINKEEGVHYVVFEGGGEDDGQILNIYHEPSVKDANLRCSASTAGQAAKADCSRVEQANNGTSPISDPCPTISITGSSGDLCRSQRYSFSATLAGLDPRFTPTFKWNVSAGTITKGQGTYSIEVDASAANGKAITATLEVGGVIPDGCPKVESYTAECPR